MFCFHKFFKKNCEYIRMENQNNNNKNIESKYLEIMKNNQNKKQYFRIRKIFYKITQYRIKRQKRKK